MSMRCFVGTGRSVQGVGHVAGINQGPDLLCQSWWLVTVLIGSAVSTPYTGRRLPLSRPDAYLRRLHAGSVGFRFG